MERRLRLNNWIDVNDRLPEAPGHYLAALRDTPTGQQSLAVLHFAEDGSWHGVLDDGMMVEYDTTLEVTHWQAPLPLPALPSLSPHARYSRHPLQGLPRRLQPGQPYTDEAGFSYRTRGSVGGWYTKVYAPDGEELQIVPGNDRESILRAVDPLKKAFERGRAMGSGERGDGEGG